MVDAHRFCENDDQNDLANLGGLDVERQEGEGEPALIAAHRDAPNQKHTDENIVKQRQKRSLTREDVDVEGSQRKIGKDTEDECARLNDDITAGALLGGGGGDHDNAVQRCNDAQRKQHHVALFENIRDFCRQLFHVSTSYPSFPYSTTNLAACKQKVLHCIEPCGTMVQNGG